MKKHLRAGATLLAAALLSGSLAGCGTKPGGSSTPAAELEVWKEYRYAEPVTIKVGIYNTGGDGWDMTKNPFLDLCRDVLNVNIEAAWNLPWAEHTEKVKLAAATDSLPDACLIFSYDLFLQMVENEKIADLSAAYNSKAGTFLREIYETYPDSAPVKEVTHNNKLYAFPSTTFNGQHAMLWIRQDWLDALNLDRPKTVEDVLNVARAFVNNDPDGNGQKDTIGIPYNRWLLGANNRSSSMDPLYYALGAYPCKWFQDENGEVFYGTVTSEMKAAVGVVANAVKEGIINPYTDGSAEISSGKCGLDFGPWWAPTGILTSSHESDPEANWVALTAPLNSEGKFVIPSESPIDMGSGLIVARAGYENTEAIVRVMYLWSQLSGQKDEELVAYYKGEEVPTGFKSPFNSQIGNIDTLYEGYEELLALKEVTDPASLNMAERRSYDLLQQYLANPAGMKTADWGGINATLVGRSQVKDPAIEYKRPCINQLNAKMIELFDDFYKHETDLIFSIVGGANELDAFDQLFTDFETMGGRETAKLIKEYLNSK